MSLKSTRIWAADPGNVQLDFLKQGGKWTVVWHSHVSDYARIRRVIIKHNEPQSVIDELQAMGLRVEHCGYTEGAR